MIHRFRQAKLFVFEPLVLAAVLVFAPLIAAAQEGQTSPSKRYPDSVFDSIGNWWNEQATKLNSTFKDTQKKLENFGEGAGNIANSTAQSAKDAAENAADAVAHIPNARVINGHEICQIAANGAPDCAAAAKSLCKAKGFASGKSLDMTRAETCPPKVYLSGHSSGPDCKIETFVSRALCQ